MFLKIVLFLAALIGGFLIYVAMMPKHYLIAREALISASPNKIFVYLNDSKKFNSWNPFVDMDPTAKMTFSGPEAGLEAKTSWEDGKQLGTGSSTIIESNPNTNVKYQLAYQKPFVGTQLAEISLKPEGSQTKVRWSVEGENAFIPRLMCSLGMNMDKMIGGSFEKGLGKLKGLAEAQ